MRIIYLFSLALALRLLLLALPHQLSGSGDEQEMLANARDLTLERNPWNLTSVWEHNPGYIAFAHVFYPVLRPAQCVLGAATCVILEAIYPGAGWVLAVWLPHIATSRVGAKWTLVGFLCTLLWYGVKLHGWYWGLAFLALVPLFFSLIGLNIGDSQSQDGLGHSSIWHRVTTVWSPHILREKGVHIPSYGYGAAWCIGLVLLVRYLPVWSVEAGLVAGLTAIAAVSFGNPCLRANFEPILIGVVVHSLRGHKPCHTYERATRFTRRKERNWSRLERLRPIKSRAI